MPILVAFDTSLDQVMPPILHLRKPSLFHRHMLVFDVKITVLEALKPLSACSFTNSGLTIGHLSRIWSVNECRDEAQAKQTGGWYLPRVDGILDRLSLWHKVGGLRGEPLIWGSSLSDCQGTFPDSRMSTEKLSMALHLRPASHPLKIDPPDP
ncbi:hypothetical protein TNCV_1774651 [Trichonephila clavipes]|nr:hypothetical protein TNCV_1774651 [Trichonephila clavipes]